jgi:hypothetical protein
MAMFTFLYVDEITAEGSHTNTNNNREIIFIIIVTVTKKLFSIYIYKVLL